MATSSSARECDPEDRELKKSTDGLQPWGLLSGFDPPHHMLFFRLCLQ